MLHLDWVRRWLGRGFWALSDRGLFSVSNFVLNILLARWLTPDGYGAFAVAFTVFLLLGAVHSGLLTEPMLVFGPAKHGDRFSEYLGVLLVWHVAFALAGSLLLIGAAAALHALGWSVTSRTLLALSVASPFILLQWLARMACYVKLEPRPAAIAGIAYLALVTGGTVALHEALLLSSASALILMGSASLVSVAWLLSRLRPRWPGGSSQAQFRKAVLEDHWAYGRWASGTGILTWIPGQVYYLVLPLWGGLSATASLRALMNLIMPILHGYSALGLLLTTVLARQRRARFRKIVAWSVLGFASGAVVYWVVLGGGRQFFVNLLYGGRYSEVSPLLWLIGVIPVMGVGATVFAPALRALQRPDRVFVAYAVSTVAALTVGLWLTVRGGPVGAALGILLSTVLTALVLGRELWKVLRDDTEAAVEPGAGDV
jgi:O-antigen/teichoic acid export membrane protein